MVALGPRQLTVGSHSHRRAPTDVAAYSAVAPDAPDALPDAATQLNVMQRIGGAAGGAGIALIVAHGLPEGPDTAFATAFTTVSGVGLAATAAAAWLWHATRRLRLETGTATAHP